MCIRDRMYVLGELRDKVFEYDLQTNASQTVCQNNAISDIIYNTTGATGIGTATNLPTGVTASWTSNLLTISGTPSAAGTFSYSVPLTGGCGSVFASGTLTVNANTTVNAGADQTLCSGESVTLSGSGAATYTWDCLLKTYPRQLDSTRSRMPSSG